MLEQAIVDAAALREAALKNAEQSLIDKYAPQIKEAVDSLLEKDVLEEQEGAAMAASAPATNSIEAPFAAAPTTDANADVTFTMTDDEQVYDFDLNALKADADQEGSEGEQESTENLMGDLGLDMPSDEEAGGGEDALLEEIMNILSEVGEEETNEEQEVIEEDIAMEMSGQHKDGTFRTDEGTLEYREEMQKALDEIEGLEDENDELKEKNEKLSESLNNLSKKNKQLLQIVNKLDNKLNEAMLSNAKLLYCNKTLSDASLNERQKSKIVEAIAKAKTPEEAKNLQEALKTTVGTSKQDGPKSLRESVNRKSNLSGIMPRRKQPEQEFSFADQMKKLAGIK
jgi:hypothetical protein